MKIPTELEFVKGLLISRNVFIDVEYSLKASEFEIRLFTFELYLKSTLLVGLKIKQVGGKTVFEAANATSKINTRQLVREVVGCDLQFLPTEGVLNNFQSLIEWLNSMAEPSFFSKLAFWRSNLPKIDIEFSIG